jgi:hypothetical protein
MNTTDLVMLTYGLSHLVQTIQANPVGGSIALAMIACLVCLVCMAAKPPKG